MGLSSKVSIYISKLGTPSRLGHKSLYTVKDFPSGAFSLNGTIRYYFYWSSVLPLLPALTNFFFYTGTKMLSNTPVAIKFVRLVLPRNDNFLPTLLSSRNPASPMLLNYGTNFDHTGPLMAHVGLFPLRCPFYRVPITFILSWCTPIR